MFYRSRLVLASEVKAAARLAMLQVDKVLEAAIATGRLKRARIRLRPWRYGRDHVERRGGDP
jgi:hypothetical protein